MFAQVCRSAAVGFAAAAVFVQAASAAGEPKNQWPFTRPVGNRAPQAATHVSTQADPLIQGEPKNEPPFTRPATIVVSSDRRFDWTSGGIGAAAGLGMTLIGAGGLSLARKSPRSA